MYYLAIQNENNELLQLSDNPNYDILHMDGISSLSAKINVSDASGFDGSMFNSSKIEDRPYVLQLKINDPVEQNRIRLYRYFNLSRYIKLYYQNETRNVYLEGYVEKIDTDLFENPQVAQIELLCPTPFFRDMEDSFISFSTVQDNFTFPFGTQDNLGPFEFSILLAEDRKNVL